MTMAAYFLNYLVVDLQFQKVCPRHHGGAQGQQTGRHVTGGVTENLQMILTQEAQRLGLS